MRGSKAASLARACSLVAASIHGEAAIRASRPARRLAISSAIWRLLSAG